jgi:hypothetical protein
MLIAKNRLLLAATFAAALAVNILPLFRPVLLGDDLEILVRSWTWQRTKATLWEPQNEHAMPLGRLSTCGLVLLASRPTSLPLAADVQGPIAQLIAMALLYLFVWRELNDERLALLATALFGVTSLYHQAIYWFAASFSLLALATLLLALLAAQAWRQTGRWRWLGACVVGTALAPAWFASGVLAGPLCTVYLLSSITEDSKQHPAKCTTQESKSRCAIPILQSLTPLLGTVGFLAVSLPKTAEQILHLEHYYGRTAAAAFNPWIGAWYTGRSLVDNLCLGQLGISALRCPVQLVPIGLLLGGGVAVWWWRRAPHRRLLVLGLAFVFSNYLLVYSARATWDYDRNGFSDAVWGRYHLLPQLGLALFVVGGLKTGIPLAARQFRLAILALAVWCVVQIPRVALHHEFRDPTEQQEVLRLIEEVDARCRRWGIDAKTAKAALGSRNVPFGSDKESAWEFLRGSDDPRPVSVEEARRLLDVSPE